MLRYECLITYYLLLKNYYIVYYFLFCDQCDQELRQSFNKFMSQQKYIFCKNLISIELQHWYLQVCESVTFCNIVASSENRKDLI
jgi:hypothetical protein